MAAAAAAGKGRGGSGMSLASEMALDKKKTKIGMKMAADVARAFKEIDADGSGTLDIKEVCTVHHHKCTTIRCAHTHACSFYRYVLTLGAGQADTAHLAGWKCCRKVDGSSNGSR